MSSKVKTHPGTIVSKDEWERICSSVRDSEKTLAEKGLARQLAFAKRLYSTYAPVPVFPTYPGMPADCRCDFLVELAFSSDGHLNNDLAEHAINTAIRTDDREFFRWLTKAIALPRIPHDDRLNGLLVSEWIQRDSNRPRSVARRFVPSSAIQPHKLPLCFFRNLALLDYCRIRLDQMNLSEEAVIKRVSRLGLLAATVRLVSRVQKNEDGLLAYSR